VCSNCGWDDARLSMRQGLFDKLSVLLFLQPLRCRKCLHRYFRFTNGWARVGVCMLIAGMLLMAGLLAMGRLHRGRIIRPAVSSPPAVPADQPKHDPLDPFAPPPAANGASAPSSGADPTPSQP
jgi:hypothetical protein